MNVASNPPTKLQTKISKTPFISPHYGPGSLRNALYLLVHCLHYTDEVIKASKVEKIAHGHMVGRKADSQTLDPLCLPSKYHLCTQKQRE